MTVVRQILADPVVHHLRPDPTRVPLGLTVGEALDYVRQHPTTGRVVYFYVVDELDRLRGVIPARRLLLAPLHCRVEDLMIRNVVAIPHTATVLEACEFFTLYRLLAFPVVDEDGRLIGVVDVDLYTEELSDLERREGNDDLFQLIGVHLTEAESRSTRTQFARRFPWLLCNIAGGLLAALLTGLYGDVATLVVVTPFIPVVLALAESVSIQSVSLALHALHAGRPTWGEFARRLTREVVVGLALGIVSGLVVGTIAVAWDGDPRIGLTLLGGIAGGVTAAAAVGLAMPVLLRIVRRDPQVASGPIALATSDMITLLVYFNLARVLLA